MILGGWGAGVQALVFPQKTDEIKFNYSHINDKQVSEQDICVHIPQQRALCDVKDVAQVKPGYLWRLCNQLV